MGGAITASPADAATAIAVVGGAPDSDPGDRGGGRVGAGSSSSSSSAAAAADDDDDDDDDRRRRPPTTGIGERRRRAADIAGGESAIIVRGSPRPRLLRTTNGLSRSCSSPRSPSSSVIVDVACVVGAGGRCAPAIRRSLATWTPFDMMMMIYTIGG